MTAILSLVLGAAYAAPPCPSPETSATLDEDVAADGAAHALVESEALVCWWIVEESGEARVAHRWSRDDRHPTRVEALSDGDVLFVMSDHRLQVRDPADDRARNLDLYLPGTPDVVIANTHHAWLAVTFPRDDEATLVMWIDTDRERVIASVALPREGLSLSFRGDDPALYLDGAHALALTADGVSALSRSPR